VYQTTTPDRRTGAIADSAFAGNGGFAGFTGRRNQNCNWGFPYSRLRVNGVPRIALFFARLSRRLLSLKIE
jgi:hypothetical protein